MIPYYKEIKEILENNHDKMNHPGRDITIYNIKKNDFYWINLKEDVIKYIQNCEICCKYKNIQKNEKQKSITILSKGPRDRYVVDLWYLPDDLIGKSNYHYVLDIIDHFSKFCQSYLLNTKESLEVFCKIRLFIENYGIPKYLISDNGSEFKNKTLKDFCIENNIK